MLTEGEKAKAILDDDQTMIKTISDATGINRITISNYRNGKTKGVGAMKYDNVVALAKLYDQAQIQTINLQKGQDFYKFSVILGERFSDMMEDADSRTANVLQNLNDLITGDEGIMLDLYKSYNQNMKLDTNSSRKIREYNFKVYNRDLSARPGQYILVTPTDPTGLNDQDDEWLEVIGNNVAEYHDDVIKYSDDIVKKIRDSNEFGM